MNTTTHPRMFFVAMIGLVVSLATAYTQEKKPAEITDPREIAYQLKKNPKPEIAVPYGYIESSANGKYFFVMRAPPDVDDSKLPGIYRDQSNKLARSYTANGVYPKGETTPLWEFKGDYIYEVMLSNDGQFLVTLEGSSWFEARYIESKKLPAEVAQRQLDSPAITFYKNGEKLKSYTVRELVNDPNLLQNSPNQVLWRAGEGMVDKTNTFNLFTQDNMQCRFDLTTGELIEKKKLDYSKQKIVFGVIFCIIGLIILLAIIWLVRGQPQPNLPAPPITTQPQQAQQPQQPQKRF